VSLGGSSGRGRASTSSWLSGTPSVPLWTRSTSSPARRWRWSGSCSGRVSRQSTRSRPSRQMRADVSSLGGPQLTVGIRWKGRARPEARRAGLPGRRPTAAPPAAPRRPPRRMPPSQVRERGDPVVRGRCCQGSLDRTHRCPEPIEGPDQSMQSWSCAKALGRCALTGPERFVPELVATSRGSSPGQARNLSPAR
jgi:hypothetical protein